MRSLPQADHADLGIVPDTDQTEDLRLNKRMAPAATGAIRNELPTNHQIEQEF